MIKINAVFLQLLNQLGRYDNNPQKENCKSNQAMNNRLDIRKINDFNSLTYKIYYLIEIFLQ